MGIFFIVFSIITLIIFFIFRLKISKLQKVLWSAVVLIIVFFLFAYLFVQGFENGRDPQLFKDEFHQSE
ncbi:hypothetical protein [Chryseobacterium sp.]|uniref:hypothetical protein n=1 Tax=Chryseobacterium sp. TaxID=1871047 RepID=UPI00321B8F04